LQSQLDQCEKHNKNKKPITIIINIFIAFLL
jgi:hypothetical protein